MKSSIFAIPGTFWMDRVDVSGEMVNIEDDECNPVKKLTGSTRMGDVEPKITFFG